MFKVTLLHSGQVKTAKFKASPNNPVAILVLLPSFFFPLPDLLWIFQSGYVICLVHSPEVRRLDLNLHQSYPWCNRQLKSFLRIYINIKLDSSRGPTSHLWVCWWDTCSSLRHRYCSLNFFIQTSLHTFIHLRTRFSANPSETYNICMWICIKNKFTTLPFSLSSKSQGYQTKLCYLTGWRPFLYYKIKLHMYSYVVFKVSSQSCFLCSKI